MSPDSNDLVYNEYGVDFAARIGSFVDFFGGNGGSVQDWFLRFFDSFVSFWNWFALFALLLSILLFFLFLYASKRYNEFADERKALVAAQEKQFALAHGMKAGNSRLDDVEQHIRSDNPNDWRLAIIEADIILEEILEDSGYAGITIGEKLKSASATSFVTLQDAWEAHKVRNKIAHQGGDFVLTKKLAQETINQYRRVFAEFGVV
jgi:Ca2+/Na+ antiporter